MACLEEMVCQEGMEEMVWMDCQEGMDYKDVKVKQPLAVLIEG